MISSINNLRLYGVKYSYVMFLNRFIWLIDGILMGIITPGQSSPGSTINNGLWIYQPLLHKQDVTQGQFLSGVQQVWMQSFHSSRPVALPRLKSPGYPTIYP